MTLLEFVLLACGGMGLFLAGWLKRRKCDCGETDE